MVHRQSDWLIVLCGGESPLHGEAASGSRSCVASATSGQKASAKMRDFDLLQAPRRRSEVDEQTRTSTIYGGTETGDFTRGGSARRDGERGVPTAWIGGLGVLPMAGGGPGRLGGGAEAGCAADAAKRRS